MEGLFDVLWNYVLPYGLAVAIILIILAGVALVLLAIFAPQVLTVIGKIIAARKEKKAQSEQNLNRQVLEKTVKGITGE